MGHVAVGLDLLDGHSDAVLAITSAEGAFKIERESHAEAPNICVLPRFPGERPRAGWSALRSHWGRGSGLPRDENRQVGLSRVPGWLAWLGIGGDVSNPRWKHRWANDKTPRRLPRVRDCMS